MLNWTVMKTRPTGSNQAVLRCHGMELDTIDETKEATTSSEETQFIQQQIEAENTRFDNTLAHYKNRVKDKETRHYKQHRALEAKLLQAIAQAEDSIADSNCWLNNGTIPKTAKPKKPTKEEKALIRSRVKKAYATSKKK